ncbi:MAG: lipoprotein-releasing system ATP-binding protein LolD [Spirochaetes bacterium]|nr:MAG: lipoprotein-releasing system ATP-binding protein LolD [Spirochaetota bacterium]
MELLKLSEVSKTYITGSEFLPVLRGINLSVKEGSTVVITGESGSGKSTLLNLIGGLDVPTSGSIMAGGYEVERLSEKELTGYRSRVIGLIFQFHYLLKDFNALENVMIPAFMAGMPRKIAERRAEELLAQVNMYNRKDHYPSELSGGERQRVAVARALINDPPIVLADEPTGNLDERNSRNVEELLFSLVKKFGKTLILVTHDSEIAKRGDCHFQLELGLLVEE